MGDLILLRHGETAWSKSGQHTGRTDIPLTPVGEAAAKALAPVLARREIVAVFTSPAQRAVRTAALAGLTGAEQDPDLWEWDYGGYEGLTTPQIQEQHPGWNLWPDGVIPGDAAHPGEQNRILDSKVIANRRVQHREFSASEPSVRLAPHAFLVGGCGAIKRSDARC